MILAIGGFIIAYLDLTAEDPVCKCDHGKPTNKADGCATDGQLNCIECWFGTPIALDNGQDICEPSERKSKEKPPKSCEAGYDLQFGTCTKITARTTQYLMYTLSKSQTVYSYTLDVDRDPVKNGKFKIPYTGPTTYI